MRPTDGGGTTTIDPQNGLFSGTTTPGRYSAVLFFRSSVRILSRGVTPGSAAFPANPRPADRHAKVDGAQPNLNRIARLRTGHIDRTGQRVVAPLAVVVGALERCREFRRNLVLRHTEALEVS